MDYTPLAAWGIPGFIIVVLAGVVVFLYKDNKRLQDKVDKVQDARLQDANEMVDKVTIPLSSLSQTMPLIYEKLKASKEQA